MTNPAEGTTPKRFRLVWDGEKYRVSLPNIETCEVVMAEDYEALEKKLAEANASLLLMQQAYPESLWHERDILRSKLTACEGERDGAIEENRASRRALANVEGECSRLWADNEALRKELELLKIGKEDNRPYIPY